MDPCSRCDFKYPVLNVNANKTDMGLFFFLLKWMCLAYVIGEYMMCELNGWLRLRIKLTATLSSCCSVANPMSKDMHVRLNRS